MNHNDQLPKPTIDLLREPLPGSAPRPGFETRLIRNLNSAAANGKTRLGWLPKALAVAALLAVLISVVSLLQQAQQPQGSTADAPPAPVQPVLELDEIRNPLSTEAEAIRSTATRTGKFLISCLPSLPDPGKSL